MTEVDIDLTEFYGHVGQAICCWQAVESKMGEIYLVLTNPPNQKATIISYFAVMNLNARLAMLDAIAQYTLKDTLLEEWNSLAGRINKHAKRRNHIAHGEIMTMDIEGDKIPWILAPTAETYDFLIKIHKELKWNQVLKLKPRKGVHIYDVEELNRSSEIFVKLHQDLDGLMTAAIGTLGEGRTRPFLTFLRR